MKYLLSTAGKAALLRFASPGTLLAFDYDGTLTSIMDAPAAAHMRFSTRRLFAALVRQYPSVVITGRARRDVRQFLNGIRPITVIGSHGLDVAGGSRRFVQRVHDWRRQLVDQVGHIAGLVIEDKCYSLSVHYRHCESPAVARQSVMEVVSAMEGLRMIGGKYVLNLVPEEAPHKGAALLSVMKERHCKRAVYIGDDDTDEDVFAVATIGKILSVRVERRRDSLAQYYIRAQSEMDTVLRVLLGRDSGGKNNPRSHT